MKKNYGVWGLGVVGKSVLNHFINHAQQMGVQELSVMDKRSPSADEELFLKEHAIAFVSQSDQDHFFKINDYIIPSPGIAIEPAAAHEHKMIEEIDLFFDHWKKPIIAVTGTVGKTSIVHMLSTILTHNGLSVTTGGNIGTGMLDLLDSDAHCALLELSSFQLERAKRFAPDLAIITNLYPNHLDRHKTMDGYLKAKYRCMMHQKTGQKALIPLALIQEIRALTDRSLHFFSAKLEESELAHLRNDDTVYYIHDQQVRKKTGTNDTVIFDKHRLPDLSYKQNWLVILAVCDMMGLLDEKFILPVLDLPQHRLEKVATVKGITFYNDSKATIPQATVAALEHLAAESARIHLFLGGLSKGVDRSKSISQLKGKVTSVTCFGVEADMLFAACEQAGIQARKYEKLEEAFQACIMQAEQNDIILFSPAGSSYDLYKDYKERGESFVKLVRRLEGNRQKELP